MAVSSISALAALPSCSSGVLQLLRPPNLWRQSKLEELSLSLSPSPSLSLFFFFFPA
ncbi:hypothetical protein ACSBR2_028030 [Camellia fascicularis]